MDFMNPDDAAREAKLDYHDLQALTQFHNHQTRKQFDRQNECEREAATILGKPKDLRQQFAARYPTVAFQTLERNELGARMKDSVSGALIEQLGFIHHGIPHLTATIGVNWDSIQIAFRADGIGIIKEESWYEFFDHALDLAQVRQECADDEQAIHEALDEHFREHIGPNLEDPFFDPASEDCSLYFQCGSEEELKRLLTLCLLTEPDIAAHADMNVQICAATDCDRPYLGDYHSYHTRRLEELLAVVLQENEPVGWSFEYNDGVANRQSGYSENAECLCWNIGELLEACSARERMAARRELREYLAARQLDLARFDVLAVKTEREVVA